MKVGEIYNGPEYVLVAMLNNGREIILNPANAIHYKGYAPGRNGEGAKASDLVIALQGGREIHIADNPENETRYHHYSAKEIIRIRSVNTAAAISELSPERTGLSLILWKMSNKVL